MTLRTLLLACALAPALALAEDPAASPPAADPAAAPAAAPAEPAAAQPATSPAPAPAAAIAVEAPLPAPPPPPPATAPYPRWGVHLGAGVPQAATLDLLYRPLPWLRLQAGPSWGYAAWGYHGGAVLSPIRWAVSPTLGLEAGRFFQADLSRLGNASAEVKPLLERVSVSYLATTLGLEFGSQRGFVFSLRLGLAWLRVDSHGTGQFTGSGGTAGQNDAVVTVTDPSVRGSLPTLQLGFQYFI